MNVKKPACVTNPARIPIRDYVCLKVLSYCIPLLDEIGEFGDHASSWDKPKYHLRDLASWDMESLSRPVRFQDQETGFHIKTMERT